MVLSYRLADGRFRAHAVVLQVAAAVLVEQHAAFAAAGLGQQDAGVRQAGRVVLDELHVLERHAGAVGQGHAVAGLDRAVGGEREHAPGAAAGDDHRLGLELLASGRCAFPWRSGPGSGRRRPAGRWRSTHRSAGSTGYCSEVWNRVCRMWKPDLSAANQVRLILHAAEGAHRHRTIRLRGSTGSPSAPVAAVPWALHG